MPRVDLGRRLTDQKLEELERKIRKEYSLAEKELKEKLDEHFRLFEIKDKTKLRQLHEGKITLSDYKKWRLGQLATGRRWEAMRKTIAEDLANRTRIAKSLARGYVADIYCLNMNYATYDIEHRLKVDTSFVLYNHEAVERILIENPELLPMPETMRERIASGAVERWEEGQIQSVTTQAILQGESIPHMADRIAMTLCVSNRKAAIRYARTATTGAENAGRLDSFKRAQSMGIKMKKVWLAVLDSRTRDAHRYLDGMSVPVDQPFENEFGKIMHPGDPTAHPANVWNCRCTMVSNLEGYETDWTDLSLRNVSKLGDMTYDEWKKAHGRSQDILEPDKVAALMRNRYIAGYRR